MLESSPRHTIWFRAFTLRQDRYLRDKCLSAAELRSFEHLSASLQEIIVSHPIQIVWTNWLLSNRGVANERHRTASIRILWGHGHGANHDTDRANVEQEKANPPDNLDSDQRNLA